VDFEALEARDPEVAIEGERDPAAASVHDREADRVGQGDDRVGESVEPRASTAVMSLERVLHRHRRARGDLVEGRERRASAGPEEQQSMNLSLCQHEIARDQQDALARALPARAEERASPYRACFCLKATKSFVAIA